MTLLHKQFAFNPLRAFLVLGFVVITLQSCNESATTSGNGVGSTALAKIFQHYWEEKMQLFPLEATATGDNRYNDQLPVTISDVYQMKLKQFYQRYVDTLKGLAGNLNQEDELSKEIFEYELNNNLEALQFKSNLMPINQFWSFTLEFPQLGSGEGNQPFKTVKDYDNFIARMEQFPAWIDTAIFNMKRGMAEGYVLPDILCEKIIPQIEGVLTTDPTNSIFYAPIKKFPSEFSAADKKRIEHAYFYQITHAILPSYSKLKQFIKEEYLPKSRKTHGLSSLPNGLAMYQFLAKNYTTTTLTPDSIYQLGLNEVARLRTEMEKIKTQVGFSGTLAEFFEHINADPQFYIFKTPKEVLDSFRSVQNTITPNLKTMFETVPKTKFEIRQTEAFRAASASAEYNAGTADGSRPGIFYTPILDAKKFNAVGMETLFLHEAIPGHHYQISLQQENKSLPEFRKYLGYSAYAEGWALYTETLGKELGVYKNPYQYLGHLSDAMHRAIRLVVDVAIHTKGMSHDDAIHYMMTNERISKAEATAEIERYMAIPGQALSYKIGQLSLLALRAKYEKELGPKFKLADFHTQVLNGGNMPLKVLEKKLSLWAKSL
ncbi:MAG: DUF885 domain-containing protein [Chitinophagaceae bacterium]|nr:DUF885 domain-containing protein [Chitinophagaceae bacterium]